MGGCGLLITGNVQIDRLHLERPGNVIIDGPPDAEAMAALRSVGAGGALGRRRLLDADRARRPPDAALGQSATRRRRPRSPLEICRATSSARPIALADDEIQAVIERFVGAAVVGARGRLHRRAAPRRARLSPVAVPQPARQRAHRWLGRQPGEPRPPAARRSSSETRAAVGRDFTLAVKLNSADFQRGGFSADDSLRVADWLAAAGVDVLEISGGTYEQPRMMDMDGLEQPDMNGLTASTAAREGYFLEFARAMQERVRSR